MSLAYINPVVLVISHCSRTEVPYKNLYLPQKILILVQEFLLTWTAEFIFSFLRMSFWSHKVFLLWVFWSCFSCFVVGLFVCGFGGGFSVCLRCFCLFVCGGFFCLFSFLFGLLTCLGLNICPQFQVSLHLFMVWPPVVTPRVPCSWIQLVALMP